MILKKQRKLIQKYLSGTASQEEIKWVDDWYNAFEANKAKDKPVPSHLAHQAKQVILDKISPLQNFSRRRLFYNSAAVFVAVVFIALLVTNLRQPRLSDDLVTIKTYGKSDTTFSTPDQTKVWLQANSELSYSSQQFGKSSRLVKLHKGQAYFEVKKNPSLPFLVVYNQTVIKVLGTGFNVSTDQRTGKFNVMVSHGLVAVSHQHKRLSQLKKGETISLDMHTGKFDTARFDVKYAAAWREQEVSLHEVSFKELSEVFFNLYQMRLASADPATEKYTYTLVINKKDTYLNTLAVITSIHQNNFKLNKDTILIY